VKETQNIATRDAKYCHKRRKILRLYRAENHYSLIGSSPYFARTLNILSIYFVYKTIYNVYRKYIQSIYKVRRWVLLVVAVKFSASFVLNDKFGVFQIGSLLHVFSMKVKHLKTLPTRTCIKNLNSLLKILALYQETGLIYLPENYRND
jgi:hypothetical protein